jgi:hypothetical protein
MVNEVFQIMVTWSSVPKPYTLVGEDLAQWRSFIEVMDLGEPCLVK